MKMPAILLQEQNVMYMYSGLHKTFQMILSPLVQTSDSIISNDGDQRR